jgi:hypothetical protein
MRKDGCDGPPIAFLTRRLRAPSASVQMGKDELVHGAVARVRLNQAVANLGQRRVGLDCQGSSANFSITMQVG